MHFCPRKQGKKRAPPSALTSSFAESGLPASFLPRPPPVAGGEMEPFDVCGCLSAFNIKEDSKRPDKTEWS